MNAKRRSNPLGKGMKNQTVYMPIELAEKLKRLAEESGLSINDFCRAILEDYAQRNAVVTVETRVSFPETPPHPNTHPDKSQPVAEGKVGEALERATNVLADSVKKKAPGKGSPKSS